MKPTLIDKYFPVVKDSLGRESVVLRVHHAIYFVLLTVLIGSQVVSKFMMSGMQILLMVNWAIEGIYILVKRSSCSVSHSKNPAAGGGRQQCRWLLYAFLVLMGVHVVWLIGTGNMSYGLDDLFRKLPLLAIPVVILTSRPLNRNQLSWLLFTFVGTVFVATIIGVVRLLTIPDLPYRETVPFISHIRFSLNICVAIVLLLWYAGFPACGKEGTKLSLKNRVTMSLLILWFIAFLFILRSYTAFLVLFFTAWIMLPIYWKQMGRARRWVLTSMATITLVFAAFVVGYVHSYYDCRDCENADLPLITANGNPYTHAQDGMVENGNMVNNYICQEELISEWPKHSAMGIYDTTPNGYTVYPTLVRYLNSKGLTKDSAGVAALDANDVALIEKGVANHVYDDGTVMRKMCYVLLFEYENYRTSGSVRNSSMLERMALWRGAWRVFCDNPLFGVGTGDGVDELHVRLQTDGSQIADTQKHAHNQYLSFLVSFGLVGFLLIAVAFVYAFRKIRLLRMPAYFAIIVILLISFISEDTMETLAGCVLCTVIPCLLAKHGSETLTKGQS